MKHSTVSSTGRTGNLSACLASALGAALTLVACGLCSCSKSADGEKAKGAVNRPVPVTAARVTTKLVPVDISTFGAVEAYACVTVRAQVSGMLTSIHFLKGQALKKGDMLFKIDPRPFDAALLQAKANLAKDAVQAHNARLDANRSEELLKKGVAAQSDYDKSQSDAAALEATMDADKAAIQNAELQLEYCYIKCPIDGKAGNLLVDAGNTVKAQDMPLVTINQVQPILVAFSVPQGRLAEIKKEMAHRKLPVTAVIPGKEAEPETGLLTFVDNTIDKTTGTILLRAEFANAQERLWPGQYVNVSLILDQQTTTVVPSAAVQNGRTSRFVFVIKPDNTVTVRPVVARRTNTDDMVVEKGLADGDRVVTDGQFGLIEGTAIELRSGLTPQSGPASGGAEAPKAAAAQPATQSPATTQPALSADANQGVRG